MLAFLTADICFIGHIVSQLYLSWFLLLRYRADNNTCTCKIQSEPISISYRHLGIISDTTQSNNFFGFFCFLSFFPNIISLLQPETYSEPSGTSIMEFFCENSRRLSGVNYFRGKLHLRCLTGF